MKIIRLTTFLDFGGIEKRLTNISMHNDSANEWIFCAIGKGGVAERAIRDNGKKVVCLNLDYRILNFKTIFSLYKFFRAEHPHVVHTSGAEANFYGVLAAFFARVPVIVSEEIGIPKQGVIARKIFQLVYVLSDFVICNSRPVQEYLIKFNRVKKYKIRLLANPIPFFPLTLRKNNESNHFKIITISRLEPVKNLQSLLRVVALLKKKGVKITYTVVGDGSAKEELISLADLLEISHSVVFVGYQEETYRYLLEADLYLLPSLTEGFSNSLAEAMYSGTPVISTRVGAAEEIIEDGVNGWLVNIDDDQQLLEKIEAVISMNAEKRKEVAEAGKKRIVANYSLAVHMRSLMELYKTK